MAGDEHGAGREAQITGDLAEITFKRLATEAGLIAVKPDPDRTGWDFCVEQAESPRGSMLDLAPAPMRWMVQVKGVRGKNSPIRISLENWRRMATEPLPWFVFIAELDNREVRAGYRVHVDEQWSARVLRALRKLSTRRQRRLNKQEMSLAWGPEHLLQPLAGTTLQKRLVEVTGEHPSEYQRRKTHAVDTLGYGPVRGVAQVEVEARHGAALADFVVGVRDTLPVRSLQVDDVRFGIPITHFRGGPGTLKGPPAPSLAKTTVSLLDKHGVLLSALEFETRHAGSVVRGLPEEHDRLVLSRPHLQVTIAGGASHLNLKLDIPDVQNPRRLGDFGPLAEFVVPLVHAREDDVHVEIRCEGGVPLEFDIGYQRDVSPMVLSYLQAFADGWWLCRRSGVSPDALIAPEQFAMQNVDLWLLRSALSGAPINWSGTAAESVQLEAGLTGTAAFKAVELGGVVFAAALSCVGVGTIKQECERRLVSVEGGRVALEREATMPRSAFEKRRESLMAEWRALAESWLVARGVVNAFMFPAEWGIER